MEPPGRERHKTEDQERTDNLQHVGSAGQDRANPVIRQNSAFLPQKRQVERIETADPLLYQPQTNHPLQNDKEETNKCLQLAGGFQGQFHARLGLQDCLCIGVRACGVCHQEAAYDIPC